MKKILRVYESNFIKDRSKVEYDRSKLCEILKLESSESQNLF